MPTYDYECKACDHAFEMFQSITARSIRKCPKCGKLKVKRLIGSGAGIIFKGSGFYQTDYRSADYKKAAEKDKPSSTSDASKSDKKTKSDSKVKADTSKSAKPSKT